MQGLVDVVRLSPQGTDTFAMLDAFRANENGAAPPPRRRTATVTVTGGGWQD